MFRSSFLRLVRNHLKAPFSTASDAPVLFEYQKNVCKVILNRPKALNALDLEMIRILQAELNKWNQDPNLKAVIFTGSGGKSFCAGGNIKPLYEAKVDPSKSNSEVEKVCDTYLREEYTLYLGIANMKPTQIAFYDGIVMGGGVGCSIHAPIRIATENSVFAMPEAKLGLVTDVSAGHFFSRLRSNLGYFLGLTGSHLKGRELVQVGVADSYLPREKLQKLEQEILEKTNTNTTVEDLRKIVKEYEESVDKKYEHEEFINEVFGKKTVKEIYDSLKQSTSNKELADKLVSQMDVQSPFAMTIIHEQIRRGKDLDLKENFKMDLRLVINFFNDIEVFEGIKCILVEKKGQPKWIYKSFDEVPKEEVQRYFEKLSSDKELQT